MFAWLDSLSNESHRSETTAGRYHLGYVGVYAVLIGLYIGAIAFHLAAARRHFRRG